MARDEKNFSWQPPKNDGGDNAAARQAWVNDVVSMGEQFNASQLANRDIGSAIDLISGRSSKKINQTRSNLTVNRGKRALREVIANIADVRAIDGYSSDNPAFQDFLGMLNKVWKAVYYEGKFPKTMKMTAQWLVAGGYSYISPVYRNVSMNSKSRRMICFDAYSCNDALVFQLPDDNNVQGAYAWTRVRFMPEYEAHAKFPKFQSKLRPVARRRYSGNASKDRLALAERFRAANMDGIYQGNWTAQMDEIRYTTIRDLSLNETKKPIPMGKPGAQESYIVPFVGMELPTAQMNNGVRVMRKATEEDCYLYPNLREIITQAGMAQPLYDGPAFALHGMHPLARFSADEWPWEPGYSLARDIFSLAETRQEFVRGLDQTAKQRFDPALMYDKTAGINRKTMENFDPYEERGRLGVEGEISDKIVKTLLPENLLNLPQWAFEWDKLLNSDQDYLLGLDALQNLAKAKAAAASGKAAENAQEDSGPIVKDISHGMEQPMSEVMEMVMYLVLQNYPTGRIMQYVGPDGVSLQTFDFDPSSLIPSHGPDEDGEAGKSIYTRQERIKTFLSNIHAQVTPGSLHGIVQTQQKLLMMQMQRAGFPLDPETLAKVMDIPNWGTLPGNTIWEKYQSWQKLQLEFAAKMKELATSLAPAGGQPTPPSAGGGHAKPGRPPSGNKPPTAKTKGSAEGPRATITES